MDWKESAVSIALATAAARMYFQAHLMPSGAPLIDGGIWGKKFEQAWRLSKREAF